RQRFAGEPEHVINYLFFLAEQVRDLMADFGFRRLDEMIGRSDLLEMLPSVEHWKTRGLNFSALLYNPQVPGRIGRRSLVAQDHGLEDCLDHVIISRAESAMAGKGRVTVEMPVRNSDRAVGAMLSGVIARRFGAEGLADDSIH